MVNRINKRGSVADIPLMIAMAFSLILVFFAVSISWSEIESQFDEQLGGEPEFDHILDQGDVAIGMLDMVIVGFLIFGMLSLIIRSVLLPVSPIFVLIYFMIVMISVIFSAIISNAYSQVIEDAIIGGVVPDYPMAHILFTNLPLFVTIMGAILLIVTYAKIRSGGTELE